jgi:DNA-binding transcriptional regulator LsrR (DeoR family)
MPLTYSLRNRVIWFFRHDGWDTMQIAERTGLKECQVYNILARRPR